MLLNCKRCGEWDYKGKQEFYATCPKCKSSVRVKEKQKEEQEKGGVGNDNSL